MLTFEHSETNEISSRAYNPLGNFQHPSLQSSFLESCVGASIYQRHYYGFWTVSLYWDMVALEDLHLGCRQVGSSSP